jgi:branched-chain amino acid transport system permease protein
MSSITRSDVAPLALAAKSSDFKWHLLAAAGFGLAALASLFVVNQYLLFLLSLSAVSAIIAVGLNVTNGYLGILNLSVAGQVAVGAYTCAILALNHTPIPLAILAAIGAGALCAAVIFLVFARLQGFFFGLATIAAAEVVRLLIRNLDGATHGVRGLRGYPELTSSASTTYVLLVACLAATVLLIAVIVRSPVGLRWRAIRENRQKALSIGIEVHKFQLAGFVLSGAIMSFGGALLALLLQYIEPNIAALGTLVQTVLMVALGGPGTLFGPVVGALAITLIPETLRMANELRLVLYGATLIVVVLALPGGILGFAREKLRTKRRLTSQSYR